MLKRQSDIYYKDVTLFGSQAVVDRLIDDIAATMDVTREDLCVVSDSMLYRYQMVDPYAYSEHQ